MKIKELTLEQIIKLCKKQHDCVSCPLINVCGILPPYLERNKDLERTIDNE